MPEHVGADIIPPGLKKRWETFGEAAKKAWKQVDKELPTASTEKRFSRFWDLMEEYAGGSSLPGDEQINEVATKLGVTSNLTPAEAKKCAELGYPVAPHPISVLAGLSKGLSYAEAEKLALSQGKYHGISELACKLRLKEAGLS